MWGLVVASLLPFVGAALLPFLSKSRGDNCGWIASGFIVASFAAVAISTPAVLHQPGAIAFEWVPSLGLQFSIAADGLSLAFAFLITGVGSIVFTFAAAYLGPEENRRRFFCYLLIFAGAMLGVVFAANLISMFVFWELTSVSSFLLIGFWHERDASRGGALKALVITAGGGLAMLVGFILIGSIVGSYEIADIMAAREQIAAHRWATAAAMLIMLGAITKSAQFPFHSWLPSAMEAPTPVSAYLHAATMVKAGLYLVARMGPVLSLIPIWTPTLTVLGIVTMTWGSFLALRQTDLKALLAFSTISQLGLIMAMFAQNTASAATAGVFHMLNHGLFKGALFLMVGVIEHEAHTRDLTKLASLRSNMPRLFAVLVLASLSMAGIPPMGGFISKELFLEEVLQMPWPLTVIAVLGACLTVGYCLVLAIGLGLTHQDEAERKHAHDAPTALLWGPAVLVFGALLLGLVPTFLAGGLIESAAAAAIGGHVPHPHLTMFHLSPTLIVSVAAISAGAAVFRFGWMRRTPDAPKLVADRVYEAWLTGLEHNAQRLTASYMSGLLWRYVTIIVCVGIISMSALAVFVGFDASAPWGARPAQTFEYVVALIPIAAAIGAVVAPTRLAAILALGASGFSLALLFSLVGAPDLALTQIMVETVSVALFLSAFVHLPAYRKLKPRKFQPLYAAVSIAFGVGVTALLHHARGQRVGGTIADYFVENSVEKAGGHNIVNVILVDFRGLDTLGEISVLGIAALTCYALIKLRPERKRP